MKKKSCLGWILISVTGLLHGSHLDTSRKQFYSFPTFMLGVIFGRFHSHWVILFEVSKPPSFWKLEKRVHNMNQNFHFPIQCTASPLFHPWVRPGAWWSSVRKKGHFWSNSPLCSSFHPGSLAPPELAGAGSRLKTVVLSWCYLFSWQLILIHIVMGFCGGPTQSLTPCHY